MMKLTVMSTKNSFTITLAALAIAASCAGNSGNSSEATQDAATKSENAEQAIDRNSEVTINDTIEWRGGTYYAEIRRYAADDSTNIIKDETGNLYADNYVSLKITHNGDVFYENLFKKSTFRPYLPDEFYGTYRLNGIVFDKITDEGLQFAASVGNASQEDEYIPYNIVISPNGSVVITKSADLDTSSKDEE